MIKITKIVKKNLDNYLAETLRLPRQLSLKRRIRHPVIIIHLIDLNDTGAGRDLFELELLGHDRRLGGIGVALDNHHTAGVVMFFTICMPSSGSGSSCEISTPTGI